MEYKKRILHIAHGIASYNNSLVEMAERLSYCGIELCVASHVDLSDVLNESKVTFVHLTADVIIADARLREFEQGKKCYQPKLILQKILASQKYRNQFLMSRELEGLVEQFNPDLLLIDIECHVAIIKLYGCGIKTILCSRWFSVFRTDNQPPMHTRLAPARNRLQGFKIRASWYLLWSKKLRLEFQSRLSMKRFWPISYGANSRLDLESVANKRGLSLRGFTDRFHWLIPHVYTELTVMSLTVSELEFSEIQDYRMSYVGPLIGDKNSTPASYAFDEDRFERFLDRRGRSSIRKLVYCSFSTFWNTDSKNLQELISVFTRCQEMDLVVGLGGSPIPEALGKLPANILALEYAPQLRVMECADVVITHGGISTINEALYHGVPLLVCSSGHVDQDGCLARVVEHGVGLATTDEKLNGAEIESLLRLLLGKEGNDVRSSVKTIQSTMHKYSSQNTMVRFLESELSV